MFRYRKTSRRSSNRSDYLARKESARILALDRLNHFAAVYAELDRINGTDYAQEMKWKRLSIRNQKSRWGSCSSRKNLNFNYRILDLSPELRDYVIAHELCHLKELHHGKAFWDVLALAIPRAREFHHTARKIKLS